MTACGLSSPTWSPPNFNLKVVEMESPRDILSVGCPQRSPPPHREHAFSHTSCARTELQVFTFVPTRFTFAHDVDPSSATLSIFPGELEWMSSKKLSLRFLTSISKGRSSINKSMSRGSEVRVTCSLRGQKGTRSRSRCEANSGVYAQGTHCLQR